MVAGVLSSCLMEKVSPWAFMSGAFSRSTSFSTSATPNWQGSMRSSSASILDMSKMSSMSVKRVCPQLRMTSTHSDCWPERLSIANRSAKPMMPFMGVRIS